MDQLIDRRNFIQLSGLGLLGAMMPAKSLLSGIAGPPKPA